MSRYTIYCLCRTALIIKVPAGLCELAQEADSVAEIEQENTSSRLTDLLHSHNEGIGVLLGVHY